MLSSPQAVCPHVVRHPVLEQRWEALTFVHWRYDAEQVQALLPPGLTVERYDGAAWVGLVPFRMVVGPPRAPVPPYLGRFCETNVRTYVRDERGRSGVWFLSLDAGRLAAVLGGRAAFGLPYFWSELSLHEDGTRVAYATDRRWPGPRAGSRLVVQVGAELGPGELGERDHWLTARWRLFGLRRGRLLHAEVEHEPWPLRRAEVVRYDDDLLPAAGLPRPVGEPLVHFSPGVSARASRPRLARD